MKTDEAFQWWLTCIPDRIGELHQALPVEVVKHLDGSLVFLDHLERHLIDHHDLDSLTKAESFPTLNRFASYIGDVAEKEMTACVWSINLTDTADVDYGFPVLKFADGRASFNPFSYTTTALDRRRGNLISQAVARRKKPSP